LELGKMSLENGDLKLVLSYAFILSGSYQDFLKLREFIKTQTNLKLVYQIASSSRLYVIKEKEWKLLKDGIERTGKGKN
jgi:hypothetical protein